MKGEIDHLRVSILIRSTTLDTQRVNLYIESSDGKFDQGISAWAKASVTPGLKVVDWNTCKKKWPHLRSIDFPKVSYHDVVDILIGLNAIHLHSAMEPDEPVARHTPLGWTCVGSPENCLSSELSCCVQSFHVQTSADLDYALRKFWELEAIAMNTDNNEVYTPAKKDAMAKVAAL